MFTDPKTGESHTAKLPTIICYIGGVLVGLGGFFQKLTGVSWEATTAFAVILFTIAGAGHFSMASKNKNGGQNGLGESKNQ